VGGGEGCKKKANGRTALGNVTGIDQPSAGHLNFEGDKGGGAVMLTNCERPGKFAREGLTKPQRIGGAANNSQTKPSSIKEEGQRKKLQPGKARKGKVCMTRSKGCSTRPGPFNLGRVKERE